MARQLKHSTQVKCPDPNYPSVPCFPHFTLCTRGIHTQGWSNWYGYYDHDRTTFRHKLTYLKIKKALRIMVIEESKVQKKPPQTSVYIF